MIRLWGRVTLTILGASVLLAGASGVGEAAPTRVAGTGTLFESASLARGPDTNGFGASVAVSGDGRTAVVGAPAQLKGGAAWVFARSGAEWREVAKLTPGAGAGNIQFGASVAIGGGGKYVVVGAPAADDDKGNVWAFRVGNGQWVGQKLKIRGGSGKSKAGTSVAISADGTRAIVGGPGNDKDKGAVWFFRRSSSSSWLQTGKVAAGDAKGAAAFGTSVAIGFEGDSAIVGGPRDFRDRGAVWMFRRTGSVWKRQATIRRTVAEGTKFGSRVSISADGYAAIVGSPSSKTRMAEKRAGGDAWILTRSGSAWTSRLLGAYLPYDLEPRHVQAFGRSVAMAPDGLTAVVGGGIANRFDNIVAGGAWTYEKSTGWIGGAKPIQSPSPSFGATAALSYDANVTAIGAAGRVSIYSPTPAVYEVAPTFGPTAGGTEVTIKGVNLVNVRSVTFGVTPATSFDVISPTSIRAVSPPGNAGQVHIRVSTAFGISPERNGGFGSPWSYFVYVAPPTVTTLAPSSGPPTGGTQVTITGTALSGATAVRFGGTAAASFTVDSATQIRATSPAGSPGTVNVIVTTPYGTSTAGDASRFTYATPIVTTTITFDTIVTGGPGQALVPVTTQFSAQGVTFNGLSAVDYSKGTAIPGFAHSGTVAVEPCVGIEFCTVPVRATFTAPVRLARAWVGFSFPLNAPLQVQLRAFDAAAAVIGSASTTLPARATPTPISVPLEVSLGSAQITRIEVAVPGGFNNALAVDDVAFQP